MFPDYQSRYAPDAPATSVFNTSVPSSYNTGNLMNYDNFSQQFASPAPELSGGLLTDPQLAGFPSTDFASGGTGFSNLFNRENMFGQGGWVSPVANLALGGFKAYTGYKQLQNMEDTLSFQKDAFSKQFENQRTLTNANLADRQARRVSASGDEAMGVEEYMQKYGV